MGRRFVLTRAVRVHAYERVRAYVGTHALGRLCTSSRIRGVMILALRLDLCSPRARGTACMSKRRTLQTMSWDFWCLERRGFPAGICYLPGERSHTGGL